MKGKGKNSELTKKLSTQRILNLLNYYTFIIIKEGRYYGVLYSNLFRNKRE